MCGIFRRGWGYDRNFMGKIWGKSGENLRNIWESEDNPMEWQHSRHNLKMRPSRSPYDYSIGRVFHYTNSLDGYYGTVAVVAHTPCSVLVNDSKRRKQYEIHHQWAKQYLRPYTTFDMFEDDTPEMTVFEMFEEDDMLEDGDTSEDNGYHNAHYSVEDPD